MRSEPFLKRRCSSNQRNMVLGRARPEPERLTREVVSRTLQGADRRTVGAWCFADHMGPEPVTETRGLDIPGELAYLG